MIRFTFNIISVLIISLAGCQSQNEKLKPNILFLFADDQRADALGCAGNPYISTPNIDALASSGVRFTNNYVMGGHHGAICAPSRAMLMSGKSLYHVYDKLDGVYTMPQHFAKHGYRTFGTGKWHNKAPSFEASFQEGNNVFIGGMSDHFNVPCSELIDGKLTDPVKKAFSTDLFADAAQGFLEDYAASDRSQPFFCYLSFTAPHDPRSPAKDYIGMYDEEGIPVPGNFKPFHPFEFMNFGIRDETLAPWPRTMKDIKASLADYYALVSHIDNRIGEMISFLKKEELYENTIIVYAEDNGLAIGSHGLLGKQNLYEHSTKVPLILTGPGLPEGETSDALVYLYDIFPSLSTLSGLPKPGGIDGEDFTPIITDEGKGRLSLFTTYTNEVRAVRTKEWKMIRYPERDYTQLFDLKEDPLELRNLSEDEKYSHKIAEMTQLMMDWQRKVDDTAPLTAEKVLPLEYDVEELEKKRKPDQHQPEYILKRFF
ncbi:MAG: choline-sulfatase [Phycisphaeraceae bacterium]|nr:choline-sulfatase [Phycisphaeraceae bacterium]